MIQPLPTDLLQLLTGSDLFIFTGGGCHIFADALCKKLPDESYTLAIMVEQETQNGVHVVATSQNHVVDALGVRATQDHLQFYTGLRNQKIVLQPVTSDELFAVVPPVDSVEPKKKWGHHLACEFVEKCRDKAFDVINEADNRYRISTLANGQKLMAQA